MRRIIPHRSTTIVSSFCAALDGGRATIAATFSTAGDGGCGFLPTDSKPNVRGKPATDIFGVFVGQTAWAPKQLRNEEVEKVRRARGILVGDYGGRATQDDKLDEDQVNTPKFSELDVFLTNLAIQCKTDHEKYEIEIVLRVFREVIEKMAQDDELDDSTQNDRLENFAEIAEDELDPLDGFTCDFMIECEKDHEKYILYEEFYKLIVKMIQDDTDDELGDATQNGRVDKLAEIAQEELDDS